jgi:prepilin-type N-terminal cleavage/methylation domain-containing protein
MNCKKGFTILELMVVIAIIAVLSAIIAVNVSRYQVKARDAKRLADAHHYSFLLQECAGNNSAFPDCGAGCDKNFGGKYHLVSSALHPDVRFQDVVLAGCPNVTGAKLGNDPVNNNLVGLAYYYYYFETGHNQVNATCRGKYVFMTNLEATKSPNHTCCITDCDRNDGTDVLYATPNSYWVVLGP